MFSCSTNELIYPKISFMGHSQRSKSSKIKILFFIDKNSDITFETFFSSTSTSLINGFAISNAKGTIEEIILAPFFNNFPTSLLFPKYASMYSCLDISPIDLIPYKET